MDKLRVAVYIDFVYEKQIGGAYTYFKHIIQRIDNYEFDNILEIFFLDRGENNPDDFHKPVVHIPYGKIVKARETKKERFYRNIFSLPVLKHFGVTERINNRIDKLVQKDIMHFLVAQKIDFIYYPFPNFKPYLFPFVATNWDVGYKSSWVTKEAYTEKKFKHIESYYRETLSRALAIIVESEAGKEELMYFERYNPDKLFVVPLLPSGIVDLVVNSEKQQEILKQYGLEKDAFYFYPAQFFAHKNHFGLVHAFFKFLKNHPHFKIVFSGSNKGNHLYIKNIVDKLGISDKVVFAGYVDDETIFTFYKNTSGLVFPAVMGPTNMPPLEAALLGCKVACSDFKGHREQLGEYALYFNPNNIDDIYAALESLLEWSGGDYKRQLIQPEVTLNSIFKQLYVPAKISETASHGVL